MVTMFVTVVAATAFASTAHAYNSENEYWTSSHGNYTPGSCCLRLKVWNAALWTEDVTAWNNGLNSWSVSPAYVSFIQTSSGYDYEVQDYSNCNDAQDGYSQWTYSGSYFVSMHGYLNQCFIRSYSAAKAQSVTVHELGHQISLGHTGPLACSNDPIMDPYTDSRYDTCAHNTPQWDDIDGIDIMY